MLSSAGIPKGCKLFMTLPIILGKVFINGGRNGTQAGRGRKWLKKLLNSNMMLTVKAQVVQSPNADSQHGAK